MRHVKSERLKKLETELNDLEQWLKLGLVPKKDIEKHREEIEAVRAKIDEEKERLHFLKESGEGEDYVAPKRATTRTAYTDMPTIPDVDMAETGAGLTDTQFDSENETTGFDSSVVNDRDDDGDEENDDEEEREGEEEEADEEMEDDESYFSDRNRWKRGGIVDPDADEW